MAGMTGNEETHKLASGTQRPGLQQQQDTDQRGIVIQLTDTEGEWDNLDDNDLIFTLDCDGKKSLSSLRNQRPCSVDIQTEGEWGLSSPAFNVPLSPSSPGSLGNSFPPGSGFLSPTHRPLASLVKSLSTELELKESSLKPKPLLSLVKSISTELSRSEPEVSQSRSDSKLNLHLLSQFTQPKSRNGDSRTAPPSPVNLSPTEPKASFFKMELEDTRRKLSEAMQEPLSMFSKIMREDSVGSPKHQRSTGSVDSSNYKGFGIGKITTELSASDSPKSARKAESEILPECNWPVRHRKRFVQKSSLSYEHHSRQVDAGPVMESSTRGSASQSTDMNRTDQDGLAEDVTEQCSSPVPGVGLAYVAFLSYCYFIFPLSAYWSGLFLGLVFGLMLGLVLIRWGSMKHMSTSQQQRLHGTSYSNSLFETLQSSVPSLKGWMNEMYTYDPETYHPSLMHTVYVTLDGPCLRLDYPRNNIPRWATFDEPCYEKHFTHSRIFRLTGSKVFLLPLALAHKRVWNRKYPICISLAEGEGAMEEDEMAEGQGEAQKVEKHPGSTTNASRPVTLYFFGRTGREKEEWFHRLFSASIQNEEDHFESVSSDKSAFHEENPLGLSHGGESSVKDSSEDVFHSDLVGRVKENILPDYTSYMTSLIFSTHPSPLQSPCQSSTQGSPTEKDQNFCCHEDETKPDWLNALIGRIFWDFLHEKYWADKVQQKIQRKLSKIRLPYFMDELTLTELAMGSSMPQITGTSLPQVNNRGLWLHVEVEYTGALQMTLETKINLSKLGKEGVPEAETELETINVFRSRLSVLADSDEESSSAGSSDEEEVSSADTQGTQTEKALPGVEGAAAGGSTSRRILRFVDKIAKSKYFQKATENEYIKKKIEEMSNTPLLLAVEVQELSGTLAINIPPPPTDRIWYSFCGPPKLDLRVRPKLGEREVTFCHVTEWIEKKLQDEFQKVFVLPNMDDIYLPLMHSGMDNAPAFPQYPAKLSQHSSMASTDRCDLENSAELQ
ncbi:testis-expressed protein 2 isoform X2 [Labeo rohita]|uniref:testis-expressed protein 2 isoform X2 n=1 Tax=Labeo rohita TaxID=84645 RepID=UPI0021E21F8B|nr:testis-expressed protein 2 isoform X2 [Labeo rohita]